jgi:hypothetical protein
LERRASDKYSSLLQKSINYGQKKFYNIDTRSFWRRTIIQEWDLVTAEKPFSSGTSGGWIRTLDPEIKE